MSMAAKLERDSRFLSNRQPVGSMHEEDARTLAGDGRTSQERAKARGIDGFAPVHSEDLQTVEVDFFVIQDANAGAGDRLQILRGIREFLVVAGDKKCTERRGKRGPRLRQG